jgi:hypothetical protein
MTGGREQLPSIPEDFDSFHSITDPIEFLSILSKELAEWAEYIQEYDKDFVQDHLL